MRGYTAFISYSNRDRKWADWAHSRIESFTFSKKMRASNKNLSKTLHPVFHDREELPGSAELGQELEYALSQSNVLVVICSKDSARSKWVNQEIIDFQHLNPGRPIVALIINGQDQNQDLNNFCLPRELHTLISQESGLVTRIDARKKGRSQAVRLALVCEIAKVPLEELEQLARSRRNRMLALCCIITLILALGTYWYIEYTIEAIHQQRLAKAEQLAMTAQSYLDSGEYGNAIDLSLQALPKNTSKPELEVSPKAVSVLQATLNQSVLPIKRLQFDNLPVRLMATATPDFFIVLDDQSNVYLVEPLESQIVWHRKFEGISHMGLNSLGDIIIRTRDSIVNLQGDTGSTQCEHLLKSQPPDIQLGSIEWVVDDHVLEWHKAEGGLIQEWDVIDTRTCKVRYSQRDCSFHAALVHVEPDKGVQIARQLYDSKLSSHFVNVVEFSFDNQKQACLSMSSFIGQMKSYRPHRWLNSDGYQGPLFVAVPQKKQMVLAAQEAKSGRFYFAHWDWENEKLLNGEVTAGRVQALEWVNRNKGLLGIYIALGNDSKRVETEMLLYDTRAMKTIGLIKGTSIGNGVVPAIWFSADGKYFVAKKGLLGGTVVGIRDKECTTSLADLNIVGSAWLNSTTAIVLCVDGQLMSLHTQGLGRVDRVFSKGRIKGYWGSRDNRHLIYSSTGSLEWLDFKSLGHTPAMTIEDPNKNKQFYGPFGDYHYMVVTERGDNKHSIELLDLKEQKIKRQIELETWPLRLRAFDRYCVYKTLKAFNILCYDQPKKMIKVPVDAVVAGISDEHQLLVVGTAKSNWGNGKDQLKIKIQTLGKESTARELSFDLLGSCFPSLMTAFYSPATHSIYIFESVIDGGKIEYHLRIIDLTNEKISKIGIYPGEVLQFGLGFPNFTETESILHFWTETFGGLIGHVFIDKTTGKVRRIDSGNNGYLVSSDALADSKIILYDQGQLKVVDMHTGGQQVLTFDAVNASHYTSSIAYYDKGEEKLVLAVHQGSNMLLANLMVAVFDLKANGNVVAKVRLPRAVAGNDYLAYDTPIFIYKEKHPGRYSIVSSQGIKYTVDTQEDWTTLLDRAIQLNIPTILLNEAK